jgi:hypothetical protein
VIKITGMWRPDATRLQRSCKPLVPGICTSAIRHDVSWTQSEFKNSAADVNV